MTLEQQPARARLMAFSAAGMYGTAGVVSLIEAATPGGPPFSIVPPLVAVGVGLLLALGGPRLPQAALACLGPIGAALIAYSIATTNAVGDGAALYVLPVLWVSYFFGARAAAVIVVWVGIVHGIALIELPGKLGFFDRWLDLMASVSIVAAVVSLLSRRNDELVARLVADARVDKLTGVLNRRGFEEQLALEKARAARAAAPIAAVCLDLDHFKRVNDQLGHDAGDRVLVRLGVVLREQARPVDVIARLGGEEFVAVLPLADAAGAYAYAERVRAALAASGIPRVTASAGVAAADGPEDLHALVRAADAALYEAKRAGRDRTVVHGAAAQAEKVSR